MPVDDTHSAYDAHADLWQKMRDVAAGEEKVKGEGVAYLPKLGGQEPDDYAAYKTRASFLNATARTIDGLSGMVFRKPPQVEHPDAMDAFMDDVDGNGQPFQAFAEGVVEEVLTVARAGVLVDFPPDTGEPRSRAQAEAEGRRPYWTCYKTEAILDWQTARVDSRTVLAQVRLMESVEEPKDEFSTEEVSQVRVLELVMADDDGNAIPPRYQQRLYRKVNNEWADVTADLTGSPAIVPVMNGAPLERIPFIFLGPRDLSMNISRPVLLDLANKNLDHYRLDADYKHGLHAVALPTPWVKGVTDKEISEGVFDAIGPTAIWMTTQSEADFGMLEFTGAGLDAIKQALERAEGQMAMLGARMLAPEKRQVEAAETAQIHRLGENSVLSSMAQAVSFGLTRAMEWAALWMDQNPERVSVQLNRDFMPAQMDAQTLTALMQAWLGGGISRETLFWNLQRGEVISPEQTLEDEQASIQDEQPPMPERQGGFPQAAE